MILKNFISIMIMIFLISSCVSDPDSLPEDSGAGIIGDGPIVREDPVSDSPQIPDEGQDDGDDQPNNDSPIPQSYSEAVGYYSNGSLLDGEDILARSGNIHKIFLQRKRSFATRELIDLVINLASEVTSRYPNVAKIQVGDLSEEKGGPAKPNHSSHQNGLDADIVYLANKPELQGQRNGYWTQYFVFKNKISSNFATKRNWEMFKYIVSKANVNRILVDPVIKKTLCQYASSIGEKAKFTEVLRRLRPVRPHHEHHFHLRLKCPADDSNCRAQVEPPQGSGC